MNEVALLVFCRHRNNSYIDRRRYLKVGGSNWGDDERGCLSPCARPNAMLEVGAGGGRPCHNQGAGVTPRENLGNFMCKMRRLWGKITLCFHSKHSAILIQTFGHKWFSEVA